MWIFLVSAGAMGAILALIGITRNRWLSVRRWTALWTGVSLAFAGLLVAVYIDGRIAAVEAVLGASTGYVAAVALHTLHHYRDETRRNLGSHTTE